MIRTLFATRALLAFYAFLATHAFANEGPGLLGVQTTAAAPAARPRPRINLETPTTVAPPASPAATPAAAPAPLSLTDRIKRWFSSLVARIPELLAVLFGRLA